jgi:hypothetical protein
VAGFAGWVASTIIFIFAAFTKNNKFLPKKGLLWGTVIVLFFALWVVGLKMA